MDYSGNWVILYSDNTYSTEDGFNNCKMKALKDLNEKKHPVYLARIGAQLGFEEFKPVTNEKDYFGR